MDIESVRKYSTSFFSRQKLIHHYTFVRVHFCGAALVRILVPAPAAFVLVSPSRVVGWAAEIKIILVWIANRSGSGKMELVMLSADSKNVCVA